MNREKDFSLRSNHREPDRVPVDLGGTPTSTISIKAYENLKSYLGNKEETRLLSYIFMTAFPDHEIIKRFGIDVRLITANPPANLKLRTNPEGRVVDEWGIVYQKHEEAQTHFVVEQEAPFRQVTQKEEVEKYAWPDPDDPTRYKGLKELAGKYRQEGFGIVVNTPLMMMTQTEWMRGLGQFMMDTILNPSLL